MTDGRWIALVAVISALLLVAVVALTLVLARTRADVRRLLDAGPQRPAEPSPPVPTNAVDDPHGAQELVPVLPVVPTRGTVVTRDGELVVLPTTDDVLEATLARPMVRGAVLTHGLAHALRPESRDRIRGLVRREYRRRRRLRLRAGRRAARVAPVEVHEAQAWMGSRTGDETRPPTPPRPAADESSWIGSGRQTGDDR